MRCFGENQIFADFLFEYRKLKLRAMIQIFAGRAEFSKVTGFSTLRRLLTELVMVDFSRISEYWREKRIVRHLLAVSAHNLDWG